MDTKNTPSVDAIAGQTVTLKDGTPYTLKNGERQNADWSITVHYEKYEPIAHSVDGTSLKVYTGLTCVMVNKKPANMKWVAIGTSWERRSNLRPTTKVASHITADDLAKVMPTWMKLAGRSAIGTIGTLNHGLDLQFRSKDKSNSDGVSDPLKLAKSKKIAMLTRYTNRSTDLPEGNQVSDEMLQMMKWVEQGIHGSELEGLQVASFNILHAKILPWIEQNNTRNLHQETPESVKETPETPETTNAA